MNYSVHVDGLNTIKNSDTLKIISGDVERRKNVSSHLSNFMNDTVTLQGEQWNKERAKIGQYQQAFNKRGEVASKMIELINKAIQILLDYLGDDIYLDPSELEELKAMVLKCENNISSLEDTINATKQETYTNSEGKLVTTTVSVYSASQKAEFRRQIQELREIIKECKRLISKIEGLPAIYQQALAILAEIEPDLKGLNDMVTSIVPSQKVIYSPV